MDWLALLLFVLLIAIAIYVAVWIVDKTFPPDLQQPARLVFGVVALVVLLLALFGRIPLPAVRL